MGLGLGSYCSLLEFTHLLLQFVQLLLLVHHQLLQLLQDLGIHHHLFGLRAGDRIRLGHQQRPRTHKQSLFPSRHDVPPFSSYNFV